MRKTLSVIACGFISATCFSQQFDGYQYDNYAGIHQVLFNPAAVAGSKYKVHVNIASVNFLAANNAYELDRKKFFKLNFKEFRLGSEYFKSLNTDKKNLWLNTDVVGISALINLSPKSGLGLTTRVRMLANEFNLSDSTFQFFSSDDGFFNTDIQEKNVQFKVHAFAEAGLTYGRIIYSTPTSALKLGITGKYIAGLGAGTIYSLNTQVNIQPTKNINQLAGDVNVLYSSNIDALQNDNYWDVFRKQNGKGWGLDAGLIYEWKPLHKKNQSKDWWLQSDPTPYKLRMSLSVTDVGFVKYDNSAHGNNYAVNATGHPTSELEKQKNEDYSAYFSRLESAGIITTAAHQETFKVKLPMAIRANVDWHIFKRLFINAAGVVNMLNRDDYAVSPSYITHVTVTPRLEKKWFSVYSPVSYNMQQQFSWGAGLRLGPIFAGSNTVLSNLVSKKNISSLDFHAGVTIPIFQMSKGKKKAKESAPKEVIKEIVITKDKDGDGVVDEKDECPDKAGEITLLGCPDKDKDGVADDKDKCPDVAGSPKYHGCPVPDSDGDGLNDDVDKCPTARGSMENKGCPEIKKEVVRKVNTAAKSVYFMTGKDIIRSVSYSKLDMIVGILKANLSLKLTIEGHTDNLGSIPVNERLSTRRAMAIKNYLVRKGIDADRLITQGYGSSKPIASNATPAGRAKNRRVEMRLGY
jgi:outer membrane protein OmpA-like peptidoglycan-associated protein